MRWKQLKQSGMSSLGIMKREPKQRCMMMKISKAALVMMKMPRALQSLGSRVICGDSNLQQKQGMRIKNKVNTKTTESPPRPPIEQEQLICRAIRQKDQNIQNVRDSSNKQHRRKYPNRADRKAILSQVSLNDFKTSSQFLRKKKAKMKLTNAQRPTNFILVSIFSKETLMKIQLATIVKPKACSIIHSEILQSCFLGLQQAIKIKKRNVETPIRLANLLYWSVTYLSSRQKLKVFDQNLTKNLLCQLVRSVYLVFVKISMVAQVEICAIICLFYTNMQTTIMGFVLFQRFVLPSDL